ncbi:hypothetical protein [Aestuariivirga sp.]|uniref:hypothetical protein n=1 Tax=Aestuariivirga sp. TaxID=2650926 RepID=UPI003919E680
MLDPPTAPGWLAGLWRRSSIVLADGTVDDTTLVYWGQTETLFVDLRIPADRPDAQGRRSFEDFSDEELLSLAEQKGFAGHVVVDGSMCTWVRYIDFRPDNGRSDQGRLRIDGDTLFEEGDPSSVLGEGYRETYHRQCRAQQRSVALYRPAGQGARENAAVLIVIDDRFLYARARPRPLPQAESLRDLIAAAGNDRELIHGYLDCEVSYGLVSEGWKVANSTIPFREGQRLTERRFSLAPESHVLATDDGNQPWSIVESTLALPELAELMNG